MIKIICPYCKKELEITNDRVLYNLNRLGQSLYKCDYCYKASLAFYDNKVLNAIKITK